MHHKTTGKRIFKFLPFGIPFLIFFILIILTLWISQMTSQYVARQAEKKFITDTNALGGDINTRVSIYLTAMYGLKGLFAASGYLKRNEFATYLDTSNIVKRFPGISGINFAQHV